MIRRKEDNQIIVLHPLYILGAVRSHKKQRMSTMIFFAQVTVHALDRE